MLCFVSKIFLKENKATYLFSIISIMSIISIPYQKSKIGTQVEDIIGRLFVGQRIERGSALKEIVFLL